MFRFAGRLPTRQNSSPATNVGWFVRQAAKDGSLPAKRNIKKQSPFFPMGPYPHSPPPGEEGKGGPENREQTLRRMRFSLEGHFLKLI